MDLGSLYARHRSTPPRPPHQRRRQHQLAGHPCERSSPRCRVNNGLTLTDHAPVIGAMASTPASRSSHPVSSPQ